MSKWGKIAASALMGYSGRNQTKSRKSGREERYSNLGKALGKATLGDKAKKKKPEKKKPKQKGPTTNSFLKRLRDLAQANYDRNA
jgi:hypothetical protein